MMLDTYMTFLVEWKRNSVSISDVTSNITIQCSLQSSNSDRLYPYNLITKPSVTLKVANKAVTPSVNYIDTRDEKKCVFATWTGNVSHHSDGTLSLPITISFTLDGASALTGGSASGTAELDTIVSATTPTLSSTTAAEGETVKITMAPANSAYRHTLTWICGNASADFAALVATEASLSITEDLMEKLIANSAGNPAAVTIRCTTYDGTASLGTKDVTLKVTIPQDDRTLPTLAFALAPTGTLPSAFSGDYLQSKTGLAVSFTGSKAQGGASLKAQSVTVAYASSSQKATSSTYQNTLTLSSLSGSGTATVTVTLKDSRGFSVSGSEKITVYGYSKPKITKNSENTGILYRRSSVDRTKLYIAAAVSFSSVGGKNKGSLQVTCYERESGSALDAVTLIENAGTSPYEVEGDVEITLDRSKAYRVILTATDTVGTVVPSEAFLVGAASCTIHEGKGGQNLGLGGFCDYEHGDGAIEVWWDTFEHEGVGAVPYLLTGTGITVKEMDAEMAAYHDETVLRSPDETVHYRFRYQPNGVHELLGPGPFLLEGYRSEEKYGWQRVTPEKTAVPMLYIRTEYEGSWGDWTKIGEQKKPTYTKIAAATDSSSVTLTVTDYDVLYLAVKPLNSTATIPMWSTIPTAAVGSDGITFQVADESNYTILTLTTTGISITGGSGKIEAIYGVKY